MLIDSFDLLCLSLLIDCIIEDSQFSLYSNDGSDTSPATDVGDRTPPATSTASGGAGSGICVTTSASVGNALNGDHHSISQQQLAQANDFSKLLPGEWLRTI